MNPNQPAVSKKTPSEKFKREVRRIWRQVTFPFRPAWGYVTRMSYDMTRARSVRVTQGRQSVMDEIAVLLIYQPKGVLRSTLWQIEWLARQGIATIVVTNAPLLPEDRERLAAVTHLVVERPNVGYDFGGYREGVMQVMERGYSPDALYVMNDSMWFPLSEDSDIIERARQAPEDVWGLFLDLDSKFRGRDVTGMEHVQSYFFRFSKPLLNDRRFWSYWKNMSLTSDKRIVIKLREVRLAGHFAKLGYSVGGQNSWQEVVDYLLTLNDEEKMDAILRHRLASHPGDGDVIAPLMGRMPALAVRDALRNEIARADIFMFSTAIHPFVQLDLGFPFLKKQRVSVMVAKRAKLVEMGIHRKFPEAMQSEIEEWDREALRG